MPDYAQPAHAEPTPGAEPTSDDPQRAYDEPIQDDPQRAHDEPIQDDPQRAHYKQKPDEDLIDLWDGST